MFRLWQKEVSLSPRSCASVTPDDHVADYQGLTRGFRYGHIFCSSITARLVNLRIGVSWEKIMIIPLHEKVKIAGVDVTFIDANHCPGSVMILFEPPDGEVIYTSTIYVMRFSFPLTVCVF